MSFERTNVSSVDSFMASGKKGFCFGIVFGMLKWV